MITTLSLNPCVDKTVTIDGFSYGGTNRVKSARSDISGKGINVSAVLKQMGEDNLCVGINFLDGGAAVTAFLDREHIPYDFVEVAGELRTNIKVFDQKTKVMSELNESGRYVNEEAVQALLSKIEQHLENTSLLVLSGSVPKGVDTAIYQTLIEMASLRGVKTIVDADGELLRKALLAKPYLIKPNKDELARTFGVPVDTKEDVVHAARQIINSGVSIVCVSMGKKGAVLVTPDAAYFSPGIDIEVKGVQGAGDSMVAGICMAIAGGLSEREMLRYGMAMAHGSLLHEGTQLATKEDFHQMLEKIPVETLEETAKSAPAPIK